MYHDQEILGKWQRQVNLLAKIVDVPVALLSFLDEAHYETLVANDGADLPWRAGYSMPVATAVYCRYVVQNDHDLLVPNTLLDPRWPSRSTMDSNLMAYYGVPVHEPSGKVWGTLCVVDHRENSYTQAKRDLLGEFRESFERDMLLWEVHGRLEKKQEALEHAYVDLQNTQDAALEREKMASLAEIMAGVAHEIKNPLQFVMSNLQFLVATLDDCLDYAKAYAHTKSYAGARAEYGELVISRREITALHKKLEEGKILSDESLVHSQRISSIIKNMLMHAHVERETGDLKAIDLNKLLRSSFELAYFGSGLGKQSPQVELVEDYDMALSAVLVKPHDLGRVFVNVISNALYALGHNPFAAERPPVIKLSTRQEENEAKVSIRDNGPGVPAQLHDKIFLPFFTTKRPEEGTGLGLSICKKIIVDDHKGELEFQSQLGSFTEFTIRLPIHKCVQ